VSYLKNISTRQTPQSEPLEGQVANSAGGHSYEIDDWARLRRFLILGSEGGSYYATEQKLTAENAQAVARCINVDGDRAVREIVAVSVAGRAPKNDPAIFALALACGTKDDVTRKLALDALPSVCRTGMHLFTFAGYVENFRGWGRGLRSAVAKWYERDDVAYQMVKYRQRGGWTHRDLLRLSKPRPERRSELDRALAWAVGKSVWPQPGIIAAFEAAQSATTPQQTVALIRLFPDLPREALNTDHLKSAEVWQALLDQGMPMTALIRNLATMTRVGVLAPMSKGAATVCAQLSDAERLRKSRVHPLAVLVALKTYEQGFSERGDSRWDPVPQIVDALDAAFYDSFGNVEATGKRVLLALDISSSMHWETIAGMPGITPRVGAAAMALVTASVEPSHHIMAFGHDLVPVSISPRQRLDDVMSTIDWIPMGGTDCALPMQWAMRMQVRAEIDTFVVYTDSETWAGAIHPSQALLEYRRGTGIDAKLVVVGMVSNGFSIADPNDPGMLDVVGFDVATPSVIAEFSA
jgi:60 kDa SS-A/Ro ribonucleoprotein